MINQEPAYELISVRTPLCWTGQDLMLLFLKDFFVCQGLDVISVCKNKFCIKDKAFARQSYGTFLSCVTLCKSLCLSFPVCHV